MKTQSAVQITSSQHQKHSMLFCEYKGFNDFFKPHFVNKPANDAVLVVIRLAQNMDFRKLSLRWVFQEGTRSNEIFPDQDDSLLARDILFQCLMYGTRGLLDLPSLWQCEAKLKLGRDCQALDDCHD